MSEPAPECNMNDESQEDVFSDTARNVITGLDVTASDGTVSLEVSAAIAETPQSCRYCPVAAMMIRNAVFLAYAHGDAQRAVYDTLDYGDVRGLPADKQESERLLDRVLRVLDDAGIPLEVVDVSISQTQAEIMDQARARVQSLDDMEVELYGMLEELQRTHSSCIQPKTVTIPRDESTRMHIQFCTSRSAIAEADAEGHSLPVYQKIDTTDETYQG